MRVYRSEPPATAGGSDKNMEELLKSLMGKKVDISCGASAAFRGDVVDVKDGVLYLRDEDEKVAYVAIDKIALISEVKENANRPGFLG